MVAMDEEAARNTSILEMTHGSSSSSTNPFSFGSLESSSLCLFLWNILLVKLRWGCPIRVRTSAHDWLCCSADPCFSSNLRSGLKERIPLVLFHGQLVISYASIRQQKWALVLMPKLFVMKSTPNTVMNKILFHTFTQNVTLSKMFSQGYKHKTNRMIRIKSCLLCVYYLVSTNYQEGDFDVPPSIK